MVKAFECCLCNVCKEGRGRVLGSEAMCVGDNGMCAVMLLRTSLSSIFEGLQRSDIGLYEAGSVGGLFGFSIGIIVASFQVLGIVLCCSE